MKPERRLGSSAVRSSVGLVIVAAIIAFLSATPATSNLRCSMEGQQPRNATTCIAKGSLGSDAEESDYFRDSEDGDEDGLPHRPAAYQANTHATTHRTRGASRALSALQLPPPPPPPQQQPQQQQQQQQQPPSPLPAFSPTCIAIVKRGKNAGGSVCGHPAGSRKPEYCQHHDGQQKRRKVAAPGAQLVGSGAGEEPNYESDGDPGGGEDELQTRGAEPQQQSKKAAAHYSKAEKISDPRSAAYKSVWHLKKHPVPTAKAGQPTPPTEPDDPQGWKLGGLPDDPTSDEFKRRNKHPGGDKFSLAPSLLTQLPRLNAAGLDVARDFIDGKTTSLPFTFFEKAFPTEAQDIILDGTNEYVAFCTETENPSPLQQPRHRQKKLTKGFSSVPSKEKPDGTMEYGFERMHLFGMIGILITAGLTQKRRLIDHWGTSLHDDYLLVRACMPRDLFLLFYSRFFHMAPTTTPVPKDDPDYDSKHHCRKFEDALNLAWSLLADPGKWLSYDEQMVKSTARAMFSVMRFNKCKPIKHGIKCWAICCPSGYCFVQYVDGGFKLDIKLRPHDNCPLGRTARTLLYVTLEACPEFSAKIVNSGVTIAMDNYFTSAVLLLSLATRDIFVVGTLRSNRSGLDGAEQLWAKHGMVVKERGDMAMARAGELVVIKWMDTVEVRLMTTKHIFKSD